MLKNWENNGTEEIALVTPPLDRPNVYRQDCVKNCKWSFKNVGISHQSREDIMHDS